MIQRRTIGIIGTGMVGMAAAYALFLKQVVGEVILIDQEPASAQVVVICAGVGQRHAGLFTVQMAMRLKIPLMVVFKH